MQAPVPANEALRLAALRALDLLDTPPEERFERITRVAQHTFGVPIALISLVDAERQWLKSRRGLASDETPRNVSFCAHALDGAGPLVVPDATQDPRFADNPLVTGPPHIRSYAGHPLRSPDGFVYGTLCIIDTVPRALSPGDLAHLADLASWCESELHNDSLTQTLAARRASEAQLRAIMDSIGDGLIVFGEGGAIESLNPAAERMFDQTAAEAIGQPIWQLVPTAYPDEPIAGLVRMAGPAPDDQRVGDRHNGGYRRERRCLRRDGQPFPAELTIAAVTAGATRRYIASIRDISERRAAEEALLQTETRLRMVITNAPIVLFAVDRVGIVTLSEGRGLAALGTLPNASVGSSVFERYLESTEMHAAFQRALAGEAFTLAFSVGGVTFETQFTPVRDSAGELDGVIGVATDITERARAERGQREAVAALEAQYRAAEQARGQTRAVIDAASDGMALVAPDRRFLTVNRRFADLFELTDEAIVGRRFEEFTPLIERAFAEPLAFQRLVAGTASDAEREFTAHVAQRWPQARDLQLFTAPVRDREGGFLGRLYVLRDITREREVDRMKTEFVSRVSHELRTPLTSIKGFVDLLLDGDAGPVGEEQREFLEIIQNNSDRLVALINDLLDLSRIESGRITLDRAPLDLRRLFQTVAAAVLPEVEAKGQTLALALPQDIPAVSGDTARVAQVIRNLLSNAHKYTPRGGSIRCTAAREGRMVRVSIRDNGIGLAPEEQQQLFTRFFRARNRTTRAVGGVGLGLVVARSLVELHGGEIAVTSAPDAGSTFSFTLPIAAIAEDGPVAASADDGGDAR